MLRILALLLVCWGLLLSPVVWAQTPEGGAEGEENVQALIEAGATAFSEKRYEEALALFERAYALDDDPAYLFNLGLIADRMGDYEEAIRYLNLYVTSPDIDLDTREEALKRLEQVKKLQALKDPNDTNPKDTDPKDTDPKDTDSKDGGETDPSKDPNGTKAEDGSTPNTEAPSLVGPITVSSVGAALLLGGGAMGVLATMKHGEFEDASSLQERRDAADAGETFALVGDVLFIAGGATAAAGIVWLIIELTSEAPASAANAQSNVHLVPIINEEQRGLGLGFTF